jgi:hypothetical protein
MSWSMKASAMKIPPVHQLVLVSRLAACRVPTNESAEDAAPPKVAARPPPFPACRSTAAMSTRLSMRRRISRNVYIGALSWKYVSVEKYAVYG